MITMFRKSIRKQFLATMVAMLFLLIIGAGVAYFAGERLAGNYMEKRREMNTKVQAIRFLENSFKNTVFSMRGYIAFKDEKELQQAYDNSRELQRAIREFQPLASSLEEKKLVRELAEFRRIYMYELVPKAAAFVKSSDYESVQRLSASGVTDRIMFFINEIEAEKAGLNRRIDTQYKQFLEQTRTLNIFLAGYFIFVFVITSGAVWLLSRRIGQPLQELTAAAEKLAAGREVHIRQIKRTDELGVLSASFVHMARTIQEREHELTAHNEELVMQQEELEKMLIETERMKNQLLEVDQLKSELVSTVSHELRTPLASILGFTELMLNRSLKEEKQRKYLTTIHQEAVRLTSLINDFLDLQRMESGSFVCSFAKVDPRLLIEQVIEAVNQTTDRHHFQLIDQRSQKWLNGDRERLIQVFTNLISNAVKFSPEGGTIVVRLTNDEQKMLIEIKDEGLGIPAADIPHLFKKFHRIDNSDRRKIGGTGLGLAICKEIVEAHEGSIAVSSEYGKGSVFSILLPLHLQEGEKQLDRPI
ncbi:sensor histidine kinase [Pseudobacillus sp. 179-B 2D1 NHS]|uniref:sensor histidine kinase n=1 Tax=Pseudobacillus sp. 179-B 2D1 NHS TaxID=3374292 RepID=UPI0038799A03